MAYKGSRTQRSRIKGLSQAGSKAASDARLNNFIENNRDLKNQSTFESLLNTVSNKPQKFSKNKESRKEFVERQIRDNDGKINSAAQAMLDFYNDGRNDYSRGLNSLRTSSQPMMDAYARKFPIENFAMNAGPMAFGAMTGVPVSLLQGAYDRAKQGGQYLKENIGPALSSGIDNTMKFAESGLDTGAQIVGDMSNTGAQMIGDVSDRGGELLQDLTDKGTNIFEQATAPNVEDLSFTVQNRPTGPRENTVNPLEKLLIDSGSVDTAGVERLFKLPRNFPGDFNNQYFTDIPDDSLRDNYLVRNPQSPYFEASQQPGPGLYGMNLNQGGLASLNNEDYMRLMGASNFGF